MQMYCVFCEVQIETLDFNLNPLYIIQSGFVLGSGSVIPSTSLLHRNCFSAAFYKKTERAVIFVATEGTVTTNQYRKPQKKYTVQLA